MLGAGPAGLLVTRALADVGVRVTLVVGGAPGRRSRGSPVRGSAGRGPSGAALNPSRHHVHVLPAATRQAVREILGADAEALDTLPGQGHPDRAVLDRILEATCRSRAVEEVPGRMRGASWEGAGGTGGTETRGPARGVRVTTTCGAQLQAELLVDASGTARASFAWASALGGRAVPMDAAPGTWRYTSVVVRGAGGPEEGDLAVAREPGAGWGVLLLGLSKGRVRATLQAPASTAPLDLSAFRNAAERYGPPKSSRLLAKGMPEGPLHRWGPHPVTRVALEECSEMPWGWLPVGDALLVTPPHLAGGVRHAAEHTGLLARGIARGATLDEIRDDMAAQARAAWLEGALADALSAI